MNWSYVTIIFLSLSLLRREETTIGKVLLWFIIALQLFMIISAYLKRTQKRYFIIQYDFQKDNGNINICSIQHTTDKNRYLNRAALYKGLSVGHDVPIEKIAIKSIIELEENDYNHWMLNKEQGVQGSDTTKAQ